MVVRRLSRADETGSDFLQEVRKGAEHAERSTIRGSYAIDGSLAMMRPKERGERERERGEDKDKGRRWGP